MRFGIPFVLVILSTAADPCSAVAQVPLSFEVSRGASSARADQSEGYGSGHATDFEMTGNFRPWLGIFGGVSKISLPCDHEDCPKSVTADVSARIIGVALTAFPNAQLRPFLRFAFVTSNTSQSGGTNIGFESKKGGSGFHLRSGVEVMSSGPVSFLFGASLLTHESYRDGPENRNIGPPFGTPQRFGGTVGRRFDMSILSFQASVRINPPRDR